MKVAVVGATGALGSELLGLLDDSRLAIDAVVPIATDRSLGTDVELGASAMPVETTLDAVRGASVAFLCAPAEAALEAARRCLHAKVPVIDCSGALALAPEVPLVATIGAPGATLDAPVLAIAPGAALAAARVLAPLAPTLGISRVVATLLESASAAGRLGVQALSEETIALLSQSDPPDPPTLGHPVAFDLLPWIGTIDDDGATPIERRFAGVVSRALGGVAVAVTALRAPVFCGEGIVLSVDANRPVSLAAAIETLAKTEGVEIGSPAPTTRSSAGSEVVQVGRLRRDPTRDTGLLLWIAADGLRLTAAHAVRVAEARFGRV